MKETYKIQVTSDIHLEFMGYDYDLEITDADVVVFAGDIGVGVRHAEWFEKELERHDKPFVYVMGNHEFYHQNMQEIRAYWQAFADNYPNFNLLDNSTAIIDGTVFVGGTLWTNLDGGNPNSEFMINEALNDFISISKDETGERFRAGDSAKEFDITFDYIKMIHEMRHADDRLVIVTHHSPSFHSTSPMFKGSAINGAFASDLNWFLGNSKANLWIHGHMHNESDYILGDTRIVANPKGYPNEGSYNRYKAPKQWNGGKIVEIK